ncbi:MAG: hypothetical protein OSB03_16805 [Vicinamibacterales bacterium]|jgi:hypothetical protein|nr:hypothetical protein [Vicinamibacterales bacterium]
MFTPPKMTAAAGAVFALLILGVWTLPAGHIRGDLTGTWRVTVRLSDSGASTLRFVFRQDEEVLTGHYDGSYGTQPLTGTLTDDRIALSFRIRDETQITFRGRLVEGHMEGTCDYGDVAGGGTWTAERATSPWSF